MPYKTKSNFQTFRFIVLASLLLLATWSLQADPKSRVHLNWLGRPEWKGKAEIAVYRGMVLRYHEWRQAKLVLITVLEPFNRKENVKSESGKDAILALKQNQLLTYQTGVYPYRQMNSIFWQANNATFLKASMSSQEWCGQTFKEVKMIPKHLQLSYNSYWEGEAVGYRRIPLIKFNRSSKKERLTAIYDELPLIVRTSDIQNYSQLSLFPLLMSSQVLRPDWDIGQPARQPKFVLAKLNFSISKLKLQARNFNKVQEIKVSFPIPTAAAAATSLTDKKNQSPPLYTDTFYVHRKGNNRVLLGWDRHDGSHFRLDELYYTAYWRQNTNKDKLSDNRIHDLKQ